jgi:hypothetical protein
MDAAPIELSAGEAVLLAGLYSVGGRHTFAPHLGDETDISRFGVEVVPQLLELEAKGAIRIRQRVIGLIGETGHYLVLATELTAAGRQALP